MIFFIIYVIHTYATSFVSLVGNIVLIMFIFKKTPLPMKPYSQVLLQTCVTDLIMAFVSAFTLFEIRTSNMRLYARSGAPWFASPTGCKPCIAIWLYLIALSTVYWSMFTQPFFRYMHIVRRTTMSPLKTWLLLILIFVFSAIITAYYSFYFCFNDDSHLTSDYIYFRSESFRSQELFSYHMSAYVFVTIVFSAFSIGIFIFCNYKISQNLKFYSTVFSRQTLKMHKDMNRKSIYQAIMPIASFNGLVAVTIALHMKSAEDTGYLLIGLMMFQYLPVMNPIITLLTIQNYRKALTWKKARSFKVSSISSSMVVGKANLYIQ